MLEWPQELEGRLRAALEEPTLMAKQLRQYRNYLELLFDVGLQSVGPPR